MELCQSSSARANAVVWSARTGRPKRQAASSSTSSGMPPQRRACQRSAGTAVTKVWREVDACGQTSCHQVWGWAAGRQAGWRLWGLQTHMTAWSSESRRNRFLKSRGTCRSLDPSGPSAAWWVVFRGVWSAFAIRHLSRVDHECEQEASASPRQAILRSTFSRFGEAQARFLKTRVTALPRPVTLDCSYLSAVLGGKELLPPSLPFPRGRILLLTEGRGPVPTWVRRCQRC